MANWRRRTKKPLTRRGLINSLYDTSCSTCGMAYQGKYRYCDCHGTKNSWSRKMKKIKKKLDKQDANMRALILAQLDIT